MSIHLHILNASGSLTAHKDLIQRIVRATVRKVQRKISLKNVDIIIKEADKPESLKDLDGIGAYCPSGYFVQLTIDTNHPSFGKSPEKLIEKSLIHELHHIVRRQAGVKIDKSSFLECMFSEGLADYFVYEMTGNLPKWITAISNKDRNRLVGRAKKIANKKWTQQDYEDWFIIGSKKHKIPKWTGYALGFEIVKNFLEKNPEQSARSLTTVPVKKILVRHDKSSTSANSVCAATASLTVSLPAILLPSSATSHTREH